MANRTVKDAKTVKGTNPQYLIEKIIRTRIYESKFWKEECFALSAELLVDKALELKYIGGSFGGNVKPTPFLCLILKMLQIQPEKDIIVEFITQQDFKYVRALGAMYMRLTGTAIDCYKYLEPLYYDYRKLKRMDKMGLLELIHMDELIDELLTEERIFDTILPRIQKRFVLEDENQLEPRVSALEEEGAEDIEEDEEGEFKDGTAGTKEVSAVAELKPDYRDWDKPRRSPSPRYQRSKSKSPHARRRADSKDRDARKNRDRERDKDRERDRGRDKERERDKERDKDRDRDKERDKRKRRSHSRDKDRSRHKKEDKEDADDRHHHHHKSKRTRSDKEAAERSDHKDSHRRDSHKDTSQSADIREANVLRAKLGMPPLRP